MTPRPDTDPLDRIEAALEAWGEQDWAGPVTRQPSEDPLGRGWRR